MNPDRQPFIDRLPLAHVALTDGACDLCGAVTLVLYDIMQDASFCSVWCRLRYATIIDRGRSYGEKTS